MTYKTFLRELRKTARQFEWEIDEDGCIRGRQAPCLWVCPITAVAHVKTGMAVSVPDHEETSKAAAWLHLDPWLTEEIAAAADDKPTESIWVLRDEIKAALNLA